MRRANRRNSIVLKAYRTSITEGAFAQVYGNLAQIGSSFITKLMVLMGASPLQYSLLSAIGQVSAVWQPLGVAFSHHIKERKWLCIWITAIGRIITLFLGLALLFPNQQKGIWFLLTILFFSAGFQSTGANIWIAWVSDLIPLKIRGRFFSRRNQILFIVGLIVSYVLSFHVDLFEAKGGNLKDAYLSFLHAERFFTQQNQPLFFAFVFVFASIIGMIGLSMLAMQPERRRQEHQQSSLSKTFMEPLRDKNFRLLLLFGIWWMLAIGIDRKSVV